jgi:large subunit ribosomal protein L30
MATKLAIKLIRSVIGCPEDQRRTVRGLGLRKTQQTVVLPDNPSTRGAAFKVRHLLDVRAVEDEA